MYMYIHMYSELELNAGVSEPSDLLSPQSFLCLAQKKCTVWNEIFYVYNTYLLHVCTCMYMYM